MICPSILRLSLKKITSLATFSFSFSWYSRTLDRMWSASRWNEGIISPRTRDLSQSMSSEAARDLLERSSIFFRSAGVARLRYPPGSESNRAWMSLIRSAGTGTWTTTRARSGSLGEVLHLLPIRWRRQVAVPTGKRVEPGMDVLDQVGGDRDLDDHESEIGISWRGPPSSSDPLASPGCGTHREASRTGHGCP